MATVLRSMLFAPGNHARRVAKALTLAADGVILDLEDAIANDEKAGARALVVAALHKPRAMLGYVRVNAISTEWCHADLVAVVQAGVDGIMLPKVETACDLHAVDWLIGCLERERGLPAGGIDLLPIIETGRGMADLPAILAASARVRRVAFGAGDFTLDMDIAWTADEAELAPYRSAVALASRAAGREAPLDTVWADLSNAEGFAASAAAARRAGFQGKMCIHPDQIAAANAAFSPAPEAVARARAAARAFREAEAKGLASIQLDGRFIDYPIALEAERLVARADAIAAKAPS